MGFLGFNVNDSESNLLWPVEFVTETKYTKLWKKKTKSHIWLCLTISTEAIEFNNLIDTIA